MTLCETVQGNLRHRLSYRDCWEEAHAPCDCYCVPPEDLLIKKVEVRRLVSDDPENVALDL